MCDGAFLMGVIGSLAEMQIQCTCNNLIKLMYKSSGQTKGGDVRSTVNNLLPGDNNYDVQAAPWLLKNLKLIDLA